MIDWLADWLVYRLTDWLNDWLTIDWLTDWPDVLSASSSSPTYSLLTRLTPDLRSTVADLLIDSDQIVLEKMVGKGTFNYKYSTYLLIKLKDMDVWYQFCVPTCRRRYKWLDPLQATSATCTVPCSPTPAVDRRRTWLSKRWKVSCIH